MDIDTGKIIAQELDWIFRNEPTFQAHGNAFVGKVGRTASGDDIRIRITLPEFYPVIRPDVNVLTEIRHPNINSNKTLALQLLDEWEPTYRLKDVISTTRRLFIRSRTSITRGVKDISMLEGKLEQEIVSLQKQIAEYNRKIAEIKTDQLQKAGVDVAVGGSFKISRQMDAECQVLAINDLLELITIKFEEADIDQVDFFRLYRKYIRELYIATRELLQIEGPNYAEKTKRPITS